MTHADTLRFTLKGFCLVKAILHSNYALFFYFQRAVMAFLFGLDPYQTKQFEV